MSHLTCDRDSKHSLGRRRVEAAAAAAAAPPPLLMLIVIVIVTLMLMSILILMQPTASHLTANKWHFARLTVAPHLQRSDVGQQAEGGVR